MEIVGIHKQAGEEEEIQITIEEETKKDSRIQNRGPEVSCRKDRVNNMEIV